MDEKPIDRNYNKPDSAISDRRFVAQLQSVEKLKQFLFDEKITLSKECIENVDLASLNNLKYANGGRSPTEDEWRALDQALANLTPLLTSELRWKLQIQELGFFFRTIPAVAIAVCVVTIGFLVIMDTIFQDKSRLPYQIAYTATVLVWTISQGVLGACAFLGASVAAQTSNETTASDLVRPAADVPDRNIVSIRLMTGALFSITIGLPLSGAALKVVWGAFLQGSVVPTIEDYAIVLAPFMFGFSTSLVLAILDRVVKGISVLFGIPNEARRGD